MYVYFDNQPFLKSLSSQTSVINSLQKKQQLFSVAICITIATAVYGIIKMHQYQKEIDRLKQQGNRLR